MCPVWFLRLLSLGVVFYADICAGAVPPCGANWFGSPCRYKCHCRYNNCDSNGECTGTSTCEQGWFGPACQYVDLVSTSTTSSTPTWVYDFPDYQCNTGQGSVTISLIDTFYFTWLRLRVNSTGASKEFTLQFVNSYGTSTSCRNMQTFGVSSTVLDIRCDPGVWFQRVTITGEGVKSLCSVYISGGRNVALGQDTSQTSTYQTYQSWKAVDGDRNPNFYQGSCTHTSVGGSNAAWTLTFQKPHQVTRYDLYNRNENTGRIQGFTLDAYQETGGSVFHYVDTSAIQNMYRIQSTIPQTPVSSVKIVATASISKDGIVLTLCEVEMYGDVTCPSGKYGRECEKSCYCAGGQTCLVSTGMCPSGCAAGYQGQTCSDPCNPGNYGDKCSKNCSINCVNQLCRASSGNCLSCKPGKQGLMCDQDCYRTYWGDKCGQRCSFNCKNQLCNNTNGECVSCVAGKFGANCTEACNETYFGEDCVMNCSANCWNQVCNAIDGSCLSCVAGKTGQFCDQECNETKFGRDCRESCSKNCPNEMCDSITGKCLFCVPGLTGDFCNKNCNATYYGGNCAKRCSSNCMNQLCNPSNGSCQSCIAGKTGEFCDIDCARTYWGDKCTERCSFNCKDQLCNNTNGACLSCVAGKFGANCTQACKTTFYGEDCVVRCSANCLNQFCNAADGRCLSCVAGKIGQLCDQDCNATYYGDNCATKCSYNCTDQLCNPSNGSCQSCIAGNTGEFCDIACNATYYGGNCATRCSSNCMDQLCNPSNGSCLSCIPGKTGEFCNEAPSDTSLPIALIAGPAGAAVVLIIVTVIGVFIWRCRRKPAKDGESMSADNAYEMPMDSSASIKTSGHPKSEYEVTQADDAKTNSYVAIRSSVANPYTTIDDIMSNPYGNISDHTHVYDALNEDRQN